MEGGPPCFPRDSSCPAVLTVPPGAAAVSPTGLSPSPVAPSSSVRLRPRFVHSVPGWPPRPGGPSNPERASAGQPCPHARFGLLPFRSPLLRESSLFLGVLRCFTSPGAHPPPMHSAAGAWASPQAGCPIRTPPDLRLPATPRGVSPLGRVLPRPQPPRHPPCALHVALASPHSGPAQGASALPSMPLQHALHIRHALPW